MSPFASTFSYLSRSRFPAAALLAVVSMAAACSSTPPTVDPEIASMEYKFRRYRGSPPPLELDRLLVETFHKRFCGECLIYSIEYRQVDSQEWDAVVERHIVKLFPPEEAREHEASGAIWEVQSCWHWRGEEWIRVLYTGPPEKLNHQGELQDIFMLLNKKGDPQSRGIPKDIDPWVQSRYLTKSTP